jgi:hypothetical protein
VRRIAALALPVALAGVLLSACTPPGSASPGASASSPPASTPSPAVASPSAPSPSAPSPVPTSAVPVDPSLLALLPAAVDGIAVAENPDAEVSAGGTADMAALATAFAAALALDAQSGDFVYAVVIRLKPGAMDAGRFRDYRDTFDAGACSQASGVAGNAEAVINGRTVYIGTCAGGLHTYHVWLDAQGVVISASASGDRRFGEILMNTLRVP